MNNSLTKAIFLLILFIFITPNVYSETIAKQLTVIEKPKPKLRVSPKYPISAAKIKKEGWATFNFTIEPDGSVSNIQLEDSFGSNAFIGSAKLALEKWEYEPALENGKPVQQCVNSVQLNFQMSEGTQSVSSKFLRKYKKINKALDNDELALSEELLNSFRPARMYNLAENNNMQTLWVKYAKAINDDKLRLKHLNKIILNKSNKTASYMLSILNERLTLEIQFFRYRAAKRTYRKIKKLEAAKPYLPTYKSLMEKVDNIVFGMEDINIPAEISNKNYWRHQLARNQFSITDIQGDLHKIEVRCANKRHIFTIEESNAWKIPTSWKHCSIDIYGDDNATFTLVELPLEDARIINKNKQETE